MIERLFPKQFDNRFNGHPAALWLLGLFIALRLIMSLNSIFNTESVAQGADGIPLDSYSADAARKVLTLFAMLALGQLVLSLTALAALIRYRSMVPFVFLLLIVEQVGRRLIVYSGAVEQAQTVSPGFYISIGLLALLLVGFMLSLWPRKCRDAGFPTS